MSNPAIIIKAPSSTGTQYTLDAPLWNYTTTINMALTIQKVTNGNYLIWDNLFTNDYRTCEVSWLISKDLTNTLISIFKNIDVGTGTARGENIDFILPSNSGFYPFGPDKGDSGTFRARIIEKPKADASIGHPMDYFNTTLKLVFNGSWPSYSLPTAIKEGNLQIGNISGLRYPDNMHIQDSDYGINTVLGGDGTPHTFIGNIDKYECGLDLICNQPNAARLVNQLVVTSRGAAINIIPPDNSYLFGRENGSTDTYACKQIKNQIVITHSEYNQFNVSLAFARIPT